MKDWKRELKWYRQRVKNVYHWLVSAACVIRYGYPARKLTVVGVTGTDGKTTTCTLIYEMLKVAGGEIKPALLSTVAARIGDKEIDTGLHTTNPDARQLQPLLARMVAEGVTHLVLEVTAHGLISCAVTWYVLECPDRASELARNLLGLAYGLLSFGVVIYLFFCPSFFERKDSHGCEGPGNS